MCARSDAWGDGDAKAVLGQEIANLRIHTIKQYRNVHPCEAERAGDTSGPTACASIKYSRVVMMLCVLRCLSGPRCYR